MERYGICHGRLLRISTCLLLRLRLARRPGRPMKQLKSISGFDCAGLAGPL